MKISILYKRRFSSQTAKKKLRNVKIQIYLLQMFFTYDMIKMYNALLYTELIIC